MQLPVQKLRFINFFIMVTVKLDGLVGFQKALFFQAAVAFVSVGFFTYVICYFILIKETQLKCYPNSKIDGNRIIHLATSWYKIIIIR